MSIYKLFNEADEMVKKIIATTVAKLEQVVGSELRKRVKNGLSKESELYELADEAYKEVMEVLTPKIQTLLKNSIENVELYIRNNIEAELVKLKAILYK